MTQISFLSGLSTSLKDLPPGFRFFFTWFFPLPFTLIGAGLLYSGLRSYKAADESLDWPQVKGVIVSSEFQSYRNNDSTSYGAEVLYEYTIQGVLYSSNRINFGGIRSSHPSAARQVVKRYPAGSEAPVFVRPDDASDSVLEPGASGATYFLPGIGTTLLCIGLILYTAVPWVFRSGGPHGREEFASLPGMNRGGKGMEE